jgi:hypothetical protein
MIIFMYIRTYSNARVSTFHKDETLLRAILRMKGNNFLMQCSGTKIAGERICSLLVKCQKNPPQLIKEGFCNLVTRELPIVFP